MTFKKKLMMIFGLMMFLMMFGYITNITASTEVNLQAPLGASIRTTGNQGIRFFAQIGENETFPTGSEHGFYVSKGDHSFLDMKTAILNGESKVNGNNLLKAKVPGKNYKFSVAICNLSGLTDEENIDRYTSDLTVIPYILLEDGTYILPTDSCTRNIGWVAKKTYEKSGYTSIALIDSIVELVGGQYLDIEQELLNLNANVYVKQGVTENRAKYFINGKYQPNVKFYNTINNASETDLTNPNICLLDSEYSENLTLSKSVTINGNNAIMNNDITVSSNNVTVNNVIMNSNIKATSTISNLTILNTVFNDAMINLQTIDGLKVDNCIFNNEKTIVNENAKIKIQLNKGTLDITNNKFNNDYYMIYIEKIDETIDYTTKYINISYNEFNNFSSTAIDIFDDNNAMDKFNYSYIIIDNNIFDYTLVKIEFTLKVLGYAPKDYAVNVDSDKYSAALTTDKNNEYVYITITLIEGYKFSDDVKVMVDGREVRPITYEIDGNKLIYTMDDPNWTDIF